MAQTKPPTVPSRYLSEIRISHERIKQVFFQCKKYEPNQILLMQVSLKRRKTCQWYHLNKYVWNKENKRKLILN